jgi:DNA-binding Xre family transcriptional regulator
MQPLAKILAKRLRALRGGAPQRAFARRLGVSVATLNRLESCQQNVTLGTLEKLCTRLKCGIGDLFEE